MESNSFDLEKHIREHRLTPAEVLYREEYWEETDFLTKLVEHEGLDQDELYQLLTENKMAFGVQKALAKDVNLPLRKRLRGIVATLNNILKNELFSDEIKEVARRELETVKRFEKEIRPVIVDPPIAPTKLSEFVNTKIKKLADFIGRFAGTHYRLLDEHRLIAALFNVYFIGEGEWTEEEIKRRLRYKDTGE